MAQQDQTATHTSYAQALLELADSRGITQQVTDDVAGIAQLIEQDATFGQYLSDPSISSTEREGVIDRTFGGRTDGVVIAFLKLLNTRNRLGEFPGIAKAFKKLLDARSGNVNVEVTVAQTLPPDELENVRQQISHKLGKNAVVTQKVDESIIGGLVLKIGDSLIDGSVKAQLETLKRKMIAAV
jgi:F-type H+-transporting ATPase subunit delta